VAMLRAMATEEDLIEAGVLNLAADVLEQRTKGRSRG
jgi:hypothetical protein